jgi:ABC-type antimicrobial peptide transport system permease subunit
MKEGLMFVGGGLLLGALISVPAAVFAARGLFTGTKATDPVPFIAAALGIIASTFVATLLPARKATETEPMEALRYE